MVLDPLSAFSLACNVIQSIEFICRILSAASEYRSGTDGTTTQQRELRHASLTLDNLCSGLQASVTTFSGTTKSSPEELRLLEANEECLRVSKDFIDLLDRLKAKDRCSPWEAIRTSVRARWYKDRMDAMQQSFSEARNNLNIAFLLYMHSKQTAALDQINDRIALSDDQTRHSILAAVDSSTVSTQDEIHKLAEELKETYLDSGEKTVTEFMSMHGDALRDVSTQLQDLLSSQRLHRVQSAEDRILISQQRILSSLYFKQLHDREDHVHVAYSSTYQWILDAPEEDWQHWDCFSTWLGACDPEQRLYWIHGKPGSGKSTVMKFLEQNISVEDHMDAWADGAAVLKASCFFWAPGNTLQKSFKGLYRSLLFQLLDQCPDMIPAVIPPRKWKAADLLGNTDLMEWTDSELRNTLEKFVQEMQPHAKIFLLIDGMDEFAGGDQDQEDLVSYIVDLARFENVKVCVSSRSLNVFDYALKGYPQLRLEDLTRGDIQHFVTSQLEQNDRFRFFERSHPNCTRDLVTAIANKARGVFLWVRLVIHDILRGLRDGDSHKQLWRKLELVPADLNSYFLRIIDSIEPQHRQEASIMLQLALHRETEFASIRPLSLCDVSFVEELREDFAVMPGYDIDCLDLEDRQGLILRIDSAFRKLNSRCKGLLECVHNDYLCDLALHEVGDDGGPLCPILSSVSTWTPGEDVTMKLEESTDTVLRNLLNVKIEFFHRTLRDFLLTPKMQEHLHHYTNGPVDARVFLCSARLVQYIALVNAGVNDDFLSGIASHLISALSVNRTTVVSARMAELMKDATEFVANEVKPPNAGWYIDASLAKWDEEQGNFLSLAIDFRLTSYVLQHLTPTAVKTKQGRPILDHILRPRFRKFTDSNIKNRWPDPEFVQAALSAGADPNEPYYNQILGSDGDDDGDEDEDEEDGSSSSGEVGAGAGAAVGETVSVWALFLCACREVLLRDGNNGHASTVGQPGYDRVVNTAYLNALVMLIIRGASPVLSQTVLSLASEPQYYYIDSDDDDDDDDKADGNDEKKSLRRRWPGLVPVASVVTRDGDTEDLYGVSDLLGFFRNCFEFDIDVLLKELRVREDRYLRDLGPRLRSRRPR